MKPHTEDSTNQLGDLTPKRGERPTRGPLKLEVIGLRGRNPYPSTLLSYSSDLKFSVAQYSLRGTFF